eukprot:gene3689-4248_t
MLDVFKDCIERIDNGSAKDPMDLFRPYISEEVYDHIREIATSQRTTSTMTSTDSLVYEDVEEQGDLVHLDSHLVAQDVAATTATNTNLTRMRQSKSLPRNAAPYPGAVSGNPSASSYSSFPQPPSTEASGRSRKQREGMPINWGAIVNMASNLTLDQVKSMLNVLVMVLSNTPITVIFRTLHRYKLLLSVVFDLLGALYRRNTKDICSQIIIAVLAYVSYTNKKDKSMDTDNRFEFDAPQYFTFLEKEEDAISSEQESDESHLSRQSMMEMYNPVIEQEMDSWFSTVHPLQEQNSISPKTTMESKPPIVGNNKENTKHNKKFGPKPEYVPRLGSVAEVRETKSVGSRGHVVGRAFLLHVIADTPLTSGVWTCISWLLFLAAH